MNAYRFGIALLFLATVLMGCATSAPPGFTTFSDAELRAARQRAVADLEREWLLDFPLEHPSLSRVDAEIAKSEHVQSEQCVAYLLQTLESIDAELSARIARMDDDDTSTQPR